MRIIVIGAGPAGLTAAIELQKKGHAVTVLEASGEVGGISRTIRHNGQRIDITLLHATDSVAWDKLKCDLNIQEQPVEALRRLGVEPADIHLRYSTRQHPERAITIVDFDVYDCVAVCYSRRLVCVFHIDTKEQMETMFSEVANNHMNQVFNH